jgi:hypothetical protein
MGTVYLANGREYAGELLAVSDSEFVILVGERVGVAHFRHVDRVLFRGFSCGEFPSPSCPSPKAIDAGRAVSRFPFGIPAAAFRALLDKGKQTAPDNLQMRIR